MSMQPIYDWIDQHADECIGDLQRFVRQPSISAQNVGAADADTSWMKVSAHVTPDDDNKGLYDDLFGRYLELYPATKDVAHHLAKLQLGD